MRAAFSAFSLMSKPGPVPSDRALDDWLEPALKYFGVASYTKILFMGIPVLSPNELIGTSIAFAILTKRFDSTF